MGTWHNSDQLYVKFGTNEGASTHKAGFYSDNMSGLQTVEVDILLASLTQTETILNDSVVIPANAQVIYVEVETVVAAATGVAIDVGLIDQDRTTEIDYDGLLAAFVAATMSEVGEVTRFYTHESFPASVATGGVLIGTELTNAGYLSASRTTSTAFTAGKVRVKVAYRAKGLDVFSPT